MMSGSLNMQFKELKNLFSKVEEILLMLSKSEVKTHYNDE